MRNHSVFSVSILSADFTRLSDQIEQIEAGEADWLHIDVMDGHFVPNLTMGPFMVEACKRATRLPIDVHLMIEKPERYLEHFAQAGADLIYVHVETCPHLHRTLQSIRQMGKQAGVVLNPGTPIAALEAVLPMADVFLVMSVNPGFSGQQFLPEAPGRIATLRKMLDTANLTARIAVDGGVSSNNLAQLSSAGADFFIASTAVFSHPSGIAAGVRDLRASISAERG